MLTFNQQCKFPLPSPSSERLTQVVPSSVVAVAARMLHDRFGCCCRAESAIRSLRVRACVCVRAGNGTADVGSSLAGRSEQSSHQR